MNKLFDVNFVKEQEREIGEKIYRSWSIFKSSDVHKALKKKKLTQEACAYIYKKASGYASDVGSFVLKSGILTLDAFAKLDLFSCVRENYDFDAFHRSVDKFKSVEEYVKYVLDNFNVDLTKTKDEVKEVVKAMSTSKSREFLCFNIIMRSEWITKVEDEKEKEKLTKLYKDLLPYMYKGGCCSILELIDSIWTLDLDFLKEIISKEKFNKREIVTILEMVFSQATCTLRSSRKSPYISIEELIHELIPYMMESVEKDRHFLTYYNEDTEERLFSLCRGRVTLSPLDEKSAAVIWDAILKPAVENNYTPSRYNRNDYIESLFEIAPSSEVDNLYDLLVKKYNEEKVHTCLCDLGESSCSGFSSTEYIAIKMAEGGADWAEVLVPVNKMFDIDFINKLDEKIKKHNEESNRIYGYAWRKNKNFSKLFNPDDFTEEFFEEFKERLDWQAISAGNNLNADFFVKYLTYIDLSYLSPVFKRKIDDRIAGCIIASDKVGLYSKTQILKNTKFLSLGFAVENLKYVVNSREWRELHAAGCDFKLKDVVEALN